MFHVHAENASARQTSSVTSITEPRASLADEGSWEQAVSVTDDI